MGFFTKGRSGSTPTPPADATPDEILASLGLSGDELADKASRYPVLTQVVGLADAVDQVGAFLAGAYLLSGGAETDEGKAALAQAAIALMVAGTFANNVMDAIKAALETANV